jgi:ParB/RepB/Spo0J family partition protein
MSSGVSTKPPTPRSRGRRTDTTVLEAAGRLPDLRHVPLEAIDLPRRPARRFLGDVAALAESMHDYGLQQPIAVRANGKRYMLTSGLRRLHAARTLGWTTILAFVRTVTADDAYLLDLIENLQRENLSADEEADAFGELIRTRGWTLHQVASGVKRSVAYISKRVRIFEDPELREAVVNRGLAVSTAEELLAADPALRPSLVERAVVERWDQARSRKAMHDAEVQLLVPDDRALPSGTNGRGKGLVMDLPAETEPTRPPGFTRAVRAFHRMILAVQREDLTPADRAALRALFRDLVIMARARTVQSPRVFPPLPSRGSQKQG